jgi:Fur family peroxide stress response transcriptional regulator
MLMCVPDVRLQELIRKMKERGHRLTPQRMAVLRILSESDGDPSAQQIYEQVKPDFPMTSLGTVYKTVTLPKEMGEVLVLDFGDDSNPYDGHRPYPHPHLVCLECKYIIDPDIPTLMTLPDEVGKSMGYQIVSHRLDFAASVRNVRRTGMYAYESLPINRPRVKAHHHQRNAFMRCECTAGIAVSDEPNVFSAPVIDPTYG